MAYIDICMHPYFLHYFVLRFKANYPNFAKQESKFYSYETYLFISYYNSDLYSFIL